MLVVYLATDKMSEPKVVFLFQISIKQTTVNNQTECHNSDNTYTDKHWNSISIIFMLDGEIRSLPMR